jgi:hypothetical protein
MTDRLRPQLKVLTDDRIEAVIDDALQILEDVGVAVEHAEAVELLVGAGAKISTDGTRVYIPADLCRQCLASAPSEFSLYDRDGTNSIKIGGEPTHFDPGSAALTLYDYERGEIRNPETKDVVEFAVLTDRIGAYDCQSTGVIPADLPEALADRFRLLISLIYGKKPVITGTFSHDGFATHRQAVGGIRLLSYRAPLLERADLRRVDFLRAKRHPGGDCLDATNRRDLPGHAGGSDRPTRYRKPERHRHPPAGRQGLSDRLRRRAVLLRHA